MAEAAEQLGLGHVASVAVDRRDHVLCCTGRTRAGGQARASAAPPVLEFDAAGKFVNAWGGPGIGLRLARQRTRHRRRLQGQRVDRRQRPGRAVAAQCSTTTCCSSSQQGEVPAADRRPDRSKGNADTKNVHQPADVFVWPKTNEAFVADGYGNRRVIVFDADTGAFKRMWGAFGNAPIDVPPAARGGGAGGARGGANAGGASAGRAGAPAARYRGHGLAAVRRSGARRQGLERRARLRGRPPNRRVQVFTPDGKYVTQMFINRAGPSPQSAAGLAFSPDASSSSSMSPTTATRGSPWSIARAWRCCTNSGSAARSRAIPGPAPPRDRLEGQHLHRRGRAGRARAAIRVQGNVEDAAAERVHAGVRAGRRPRGDRAPFRPRPGARRLSAWTSTMANPYRVMPSWPRLGEIKPGAAIGLLPDGTGGVWMQHRSGTTIMHLDRAATL